jgi:hypothetical protein
MNVEVSLEEKLLAEVVSAGKPRGLEPAQIIREALLAWLKRHGGQQFEQEWSAALKQKPDEASRAEDWFEAQAWSES